MLIGHTAPVKYVFSTQINFDSVILGVLQRPLLELTVITLLLAARLVKCPPGIQLMELV